MTPTLIEIYREDMRGLSTKEAKLRRKFWHYGAKLYLIFHSMTSDTAGEPPQHVEVIRGERVVISETVIPDLRFWLRWSRSEIVELYRVSAPVKKAA